MLYKPRSYRTSLSPDRNITGLIGSRTDRVLAQCRCNAGYIVPTLCKRWFSVSCLPYLHVLHCFCLDSLRCRCHHVVHILLLLQIYVEITSDSILHSPITRRYITNPADMAHWGSAGSMLGRRFRRLVNITPRAAKTVDILNKIPLKLVTYLAVDAQLFK